MKLGTAVRSYRYGPAVRPVFVVGCPRSGTSWVRNILGRHPGVHAGPESHLYPTVHGVAMTWGEGPARWSEIGARYDTLSGHGGSGPHRWIDRASFGELLDTAAGSPRHSLDVADDVVAGVLDHYTRRRRLGPDVVLVEKTPEHIRWAGRILDRFPDARIVEVRRDGRDVCVSMERRATRVSWPPRDRQEQIERWIEAVELGLRCGADARYAPRWHVVGFEDLTTARCAELSRLFAFVGLDADNALIGHIAAATDISRQHITGDGEHVRTGAMGDWRRYFDQSDVALFDELAGDLSRRIGYGA